MRYEDARHKADGWVLTLFVVALLALACVARADEPTFAQGKPVEGPTLTLPAPPPVEGDCLVVRGGVLVKVECVEGCKAMLRDVSAALVNIAAQVNGAARAQP